jgi:hypothetical protein
MLEIVNLERSLTNQRSVELELKGGKKRQTNKGGKEWLYK